MRGPADGADKSGDEWRKKRMKGLRKGRFRNAQRENQNPRWAADERRSTPIKQVIGKPAWS
jgi:hypothetical protein